MASPEAGEPRRHSAVVRGAVAIAFLCGSLAVAHAAWGAFTGPATVTHADATGTVNLSMAGANNRLSVNMPGMYPGILRLSRGSCSPTAAP